MCCIERPNRTVLHEALALHVNMVSRIMEIHKKRLLNSFEQVLSSQHQSDYLKTAAAVYLLKQLLSDKQREQKREREMGARREKEREREREQGNMSSVASTPASWQQCGGVHDVDCGRPNPAVLRRALKTSGQGQASRQPLFWIGWLSACRILGLSLNGWSLQYNLRCYSQ